LLTTWLKVIKPFSSSFMVSQWSSAHSEYLLWSCCRTWNCFKL